MSNGENPGTINKAGVIEATHGAHVTARMENCPINILAGTSQQNSERGKEEKQKKNTLKTVTVKTALGEFHVTENEVLDRQKMTIMTDRGAENEGCFEFYGSYFKELDPLKPGTNVYGGYQKFPAGEKLLLAIKTIRPYEARNNEEVKHLLALKFHSNIVQIVAAVEHKIPSPELWILMERCKTDNLQDYVKRNRDENRVLDILQTTRYTRHLVEGVKYIHEKGIVHRDLKPDNIFFSLDEKFLKIADFGLSKKLENGCSTAKASRRDEGTNGYRAPETYLNNDIKRYSDIFSLGLVIHVLWTNGDHPFGPNRYKWAGYIQEEKKHEKKCDLSKLPENCPKKDCLLNLLTNMLQFHPRNRPSIQEIASSGFFNTDPQSERGILTDRGDTVPRSQPEYTIPSTAGTSKIKPTAKSKNRTEGIRPPPATAPLKSTPAAKNKSLTDARRAPPATTAPFKVNPAARSKNRTDAKRPPTVEVPSTEVKNKKARTTECSTATSSRNELNPPGQDDLQIRLKNYLCYKKEPPQILMVAQLAEMEPQPPLDQGFTSAFPMPDCMSMKVNEEIRFQLVCKSPIDCELEPSKGTKIKGTKIMSDKTTWTLFTFKDPPNQKLVHIQYIVSEPNSPEKGQSLLALSWNSDIEENQAPQAAASTSASEFKESWRAERDATTCNQTQSMKHSTKEFYQFHLTNDSIYHMGPDRKKGCALIINNEFLGQPMERKGSLVDLENMTSLWKELGFKVNEERNHTADEMRRIFHEFAMEAVGYSCIVVILMTHGFQVNGREVCFGEDQKLICILDIISAFDSRNAPHLQGIPKLLLFQMCRGNNMDRRQLDCDSTMTDAGVTPQEDQTVDNMENIFPEKSDMLIAYPSQSGYVAYRDSMTGSWLINAIANVFKEHAHDTHVMDMLTKVNFAVATKSSPYPGVQISNQECYLTKYLYLFPGWPRKEEGPV